MQAWTAVSLQALCGLLAKDRVPCMFRLFYYITLGISVSSEY